MLESMDEFYLIVSYFLMLLGAVSGVTLFVKASKAPEGKKLNLTLLLLFIFSFLFGILLYTIGE